MGFDVNAWGEQPLWWSERQRSKGLVWPAGADWFANDPLGPMPHTHPDASEAFFVAHGTLRETVGMTDVELGPGDFCLLEPDTYHTSLNAGEGDLCLLVVVAPNWRDRRWKPEGFTDTDYEGTTTVVGTGEPGPLPSDERLESAVVELGPEAASGPERRLDADRVIYVLDGVAAVTVEHLSGELNPHQYVQVMSGARHRIANAGSEPLRFMSIWARG